MTIIAAYRGSDGIYIGSDSCGVMNQEISSDIGPKLIRHGNYIVGFTKSYRTADIIQESNKIPDRIDSIYGVREFRDVLQDALKTEVKDKNGAENSQLWVLIATPRDIWHICTDYMINRVLHYDAIGSGYQVAIGSLFTSWQAKETAKKAVTLAVKSAIKHQVYCGGKAFVWEAKENK